MLARLNLDPAETLIPIGFGLVAVAVGILAGVDPRLAVAASMGVAFLLIALASLTAGVVAFTLIVFLELAPAIGGPALSFTKIAGAVLVISWLAKYAYRERFDNTFWAEMPAFFVLVVAIVVWTTASSFWAEDPEVARVGITKVALDAALFVIVFDAIKKPEHVRAIMGAFVAGASIAAAYGLVSSPDASAFAYSATSSEGLGRIAGTIGDPNVLAALLVVGLILGLALAATSRRSPAIMAMALFGATLCAAGIALTGSRGGLVALAAGFLAAILFAPRRRVAVAVVALLIAGSVAFYYTSIAPDAARERISTSDGGSGRTDIWKIAWRMIEDKPIIGVGSGNFQVASIHYLLVEPGAIESDNYIVDQPAVAHNTYLQVQAELGVVGLALFMGVFLGSVAACIKAARTFGKKKDRSMEILASAAAVALIAIGAADTFISEEFNKHLWLLFSLGPAMLSIARHKEAPRGDQSSSSFS